MDILDFLRDQQWGGAALVIGIISILLAIIAIYLTWKFRQKKEISYTIAVDNSLIILNPALEPLYGRLKIQLDEEPVQSLRFVSMIFKNTGNTEIRAEDYDEPITIDFGEDVKILPDITINTKNKAVEEYLKPTVEGAKVIFPKKTFNKGIQFSIGIYLIDYNKEIPKPKALIAGIKEIKKNENLVTGYSPRVITILLLVSLLMLLMVALVKTIYDLSSGKLFSESLIFLTGVCGLSALVYIFIELFFNPSKQE